MTRPIAAAAVVGVTAVNYRGVRKTAALTRIIVALVLAALTVVVVGTAFGGRATTANLGDVGGHGAYGILQSAGLLFFAFAGYARIATLGEEVADPAATIPKAIPRALAITLVVYAAVALSALAAVGPAVLAGSDTPLATALQAGRFDALGPVVRVGGAIAALGVLLSLIAGVSRTVFAMASDGELPRWLDAVHASHKVPHRADVVIGAAVAVLVCLTDLRHAIGFSSFCVLVYYAVANASAWTLPAEHRRWPRALAALGLLGCIVLACTLPAATVLAGGAVLAAGVIVRAIRRRGRR
jgi:APA family basic amino acid/polyamine antiporter